MVNDEASYGKDEYPALVGKQDITLHAAIHIPVASGRPSIWKAGAVPIWIMRMQIRILTTLPFSSI